MVITSNNIRLAAISNMIFKARRESKVEIYTVKENLIKFIRITWDNKTLIEIGMIKTFLIKKV